MTDAMTDGRFRGWGGVAGMAAACALTAAVTLLPLARRRRGRPGSRTRPARARPRRRARQGGQLHGPGAPRLPSSSAGGPTIDAISAARAS